MVMFYSVTGVSVPAGCLYMGDMAFGDREATAEEIAADALSKLPSPLQQIRALEQKYSDDMANGTRISLIALALKEAQSQGYTHTQLMALNSGYRKMVELEEQIKPLRALL